MIFKEELKNLRTICRDCACNECCGVSLCDIIGLEGFTKEPKLWTDKDIREILDYVNDSEM